MIQFKILTMGLVLLAGGSASANEDLRCVFDKTLIFGASISAGYARPADVVKAMIRYGRFGERMPLNKPLLGPRTSPGELLAEENEGHVTNIARILGRGSVPQSTNDAILHNLDSSKLRSFKIKSESRDLDKEIKLCQETMRVFAMGGSTRRDIPSSSRALDRYIQNLDVNCKNLVKQRQVADVIDKMNGTDSWIGIDAYYWETIAPFGEDPINNEEHRARMEYKCNAAVRNIFQITSLARRHGKVLVLGNIPEDKMENVTRLIKNIWTPPYKPCADKINEALVDQCHSQDRCYILDMKAIEHDLNDGDGIFFEGATRYSSDMRSDGLHLTALGSRYLATKLEQLLKDGRACSAPIQNLGGNSQPTSLRNVD